MSYRYSLTVKGKTLASDATEGEVVWAIENATGMTWAEFMTHETPLGDLHDDIDLTDLKAWTEYLLRYMPRILLGRYASVAFCVKFYEVFLTRERKL